MSRNRSAAVVLGGDLKRRQNVPWSPGEVERSRRDCDDLIGELTVELQRRRIDVGLALFSVQLRAAPLRRCRTAAHSVEVVIARRAVFELGKERQAGC